MGAPAIFKQPIDIRLLHPASNLKSRMHQHYRQKWQEREQQVHTVLGTRVKQLLAILGSLLP
ncbi:MAG: hypothetical protein P8X74_10930 [Reinekea sp.]